VLLPHRRPQPARPPNGPPFFNFGLVTDAQAADKPDDSGEASVLSCGRSAFLFVDFWLRGFGRRRSSQSPPPLARVLSLGNISMVASVSPRAPPTSGIMIGALHTALKSCSRGRQPLLQFRPRAALMSALQLSVCYYRRELAPGWAQLVLDTALLVLDTIRRHTIGPWGRSRRKRRPRISRRTRARSA
jgi:hypothetical protein